MGLIVPTDPGINRVAFGREFCLLKRALSLWYILMTFFEALIMRLPPDGHPRAPPKRTGDRLRSMKHIQEQGLLYVVLHHFTVIILTPATTP